MTVNLRPLTPSVPNWHLLTLRLALVYNWDSPASFTALRYVTFSCSFVEVRVPQCAEYDE